MSIDQFLADVPRTKFGAFINKYLTDISGIVDPFSGKTETKTLEDVATEFRQQLQIMQNGNNEDKLYTYYTRLVRLNLFTDKRNGTVQINQPAKDSEKYDFRYTNYDDIRFHRLNKMERPQVFKAHIFEPKYYSNDSYNTRKSVPLIINFHDGKVSASNPLSFKISQKFHLHQWFGKAIFNHVDSERTYLGNFYKYIDVEYTMWPKLKFPWQHEQCYQLVVEWVKDNAEALNIDTSHVFLAGKGIGAYLAASVAYMWASRGKQNVKLRGLILDSPIFYNPTLYDPNDGSRSSKIWKDLVASKRDLDHPYINLMANDLSGMPETMICTLDNDKNKEAIYAFSEKLSAENQDNPDISAQGDPCYILTFRSGYGKIVLGSHVYTSLQWEVAYSNFLVWRIMPKSLLPPSPGIRYRIKHFMLAGVVGLSVGYVLNDTELNELLFAVSGWGQTLETLLTWGLEAVEMRYKITNPMLGGVVGLPTDYVLNDTELNELLFAVSGWGQTLETLLTWGLEETWIVIETSLKQLPETEIKTLISQLPNNM